MSIRIKKTTFKRSKEAGLLAIQKHRYGAELTKKKSSGSSKWDTDPRSGNSPYAPVRNLIRLAPVAQRLVKAVSRNKCLSCG